MAFKRTAAQRARAAQMKGAANDEYSEADAARGPCPDHTESGESTVDFCAKLPKTLWGHAAKGRLLLMPRTEMVVVPFQLAGGGGSGGWNCVVVRGNRTYPRGGYELFVGMEEIETATILDPEQLAPDYQCPNCGDAGGT